MTRPRLQDSTDDRTSWGIAGRDIYLLGVLRRRMDYTELKRTVVAEYAGSNTMSS